MPKFHFSLVAPERELYAGEVDAPGAEGGFYRVGMIETAETPAAGGVMLAALAFLLQTAAFPPNAAVRAPDDKLTYAAGIAITQCIMMREGQTSRAGFIAGVGPLRQRLAADPRLEGVTVDDAGGTGCRVSFTGTRAEADLMAARAAAQPPNQIAFSRRPAPAGLERVSTTLIDPRP